MRSSIRCSATALPAIFAASLAHAAGSCPPIEHSAELLRPGALVLLGEMHGSQESPRLRAISSARPHHAVRRRFSGDATGRDEAMAARLRETKAAAPKAIVIALNGNFHNSLAPGGATAPMGARVRDLGPTALTVSYMSGHIWACMPACSVHAIEGSGKNAAAWSIELDPVSMDDRRWSGVFHVGALHASPPRVRATTP